MLFTLTWLCNHLVGRLSQGQATNSSSTVCSNLSSHTNSSSHTTSSCHSSMCGKIHIECVACTQQRDAKRPQTPHLDHHTCKPCEHSECNIQSAPPGILARRDSLAQRRGSVTFSEKTGVLPLQPSYDLTSMSGVPASNLWAWSRSSTWIDGEVNSFTSQYHSHYWAALGL